MLNYYLYLLLIYLLYIIQLHGLEESMNFYKKLNNYQVLLMMVNDIVFRHLLQNGFIFIMYVLYLCKEIDANHLQITHSIYDQIMNHREGMEAFCNHLTDEYGYVMIVVLMSRQSLFFLFFLFFNLTMFWYVNMFIYIMYNRLESILFLIEVTQFKAVVYRQSLSTPNQLLSFCFNVIYIKPIIFCMFIDVNH